MTFGLDSSVVPIVSGLLQNDSKCGFEMPFDKLRVSGGMTFGLDSSVVPIVWDSFRMTIKWARGMPFDTLRVSGGITFGLDSSVVLPMREGLLQNDN